MKFLFLAVILIFSRYVVADLLSDERVLYVEGQKIILFAMFSSIRKGMFLMLSHNGGFLICQRPVVRYIAVPCTSFMTCM